MTDTRKGYPVIPQENTYARVADAIDSLSNTRVKKEFLGGLVEFEIGYFDTNSGTGLYCWVVFNATNDTDATTKLADATAREEIHFGHIRKFSFSDASPVTRMDFVAANAESGASRVTISGLSIE